METSQRIYRVLLGLLCIGFAVSAAAQGKVETNTLCAAVQAGDLEAAKKAVAAGYKVNESCSKDLSAWPLHLAVKRGDITMVRFLLEQGADVNQMNQIGFLSPLHLAALLHDDVTLASVLVDAGADIQAYNDEGITVLDFATLEGHQKVAEYLASKGAKRGEDPGKDALQQIGASGSAQKASPPQTVPVSANRTPNGQLLFKGLYLGMPVEEAARKMLNYGLTPGGDGKHGYPQSVLDESPDGLAPHRIEGPWRGTEPLRIETDPFGISTLRRTIAANSWQMQIDAENRVQQFSFSAGATTVIFGSADMSGAEFAQAFIDAYAIPELQAIPVQQGALEQYFSDSRFRMGWEYVDRQNGWGVRIEENKGLTVSRLTRTTETKFD